MHVVWLAWYIVWFGWAHQSPQPRKPEPPDA
jgi:hypothetical protein